MKKFWSSVSLFAAALAFLVVGTASPAYARHHHKHHKTHHVSSRHHRAKTSSETMSVRGAQQALANLGYYSGRIDGKNGPRMKTALRAFQRDRRLTITGQLDYETKQALLGTSTSLGGSGGYGTNRFPNAGKFGVHTMTNGQPMEAKPDYALTSRYGKIDVAENQGTYEVSLNGQIVLSAQNQPGPLKVSKVYDVDGEDVVLFTAYSAVPSCRYQTDLLVIRPNGSTSGLQPVPNCAEVHTEQVTNGTLVINFPNPIEERSTGDYWRYDHGRIISML